MSTLIIVGVGIALCGIAWYDHCTSHISLWVTLPATITAWGIRGALVGWPSLVHALVAWFAAVAVFAWPVFRGGMGGGDLLLMGALASLLSWFQALQLVTVVALVGALIAAGIWVAHRRSATTIPSFAYGWAFLGGWWGYWLWQWGGFGHG